MPASSLGRRRSRPVADAPALDGAEVAKAWLVELVALAPLERAAHLPGPRFADDAPRLCAAVAGALAADPALEDLEPGGALAPLAAGAGQLAAALDTHDAVVALEALRSVVWAALLEAVDRPVPAQVGDLADRLGHVVATLAAASLGAPAPGPSRSGDRGPLASVLRDVREVTDRVDPSPAPPAPETERVPAQPAEVEYVPDPPRFSSDDPPAPPESPPASAHAGPRVEVAPPERPPLRSVPAGEDTGEDDGAQAPGTSAGDALARIEETLRDAAHAADPLRAAAERLRALAASAPPADDPFAAAATRLRSTLPPVDEPRIRRMPAPEDAADLLDPRVTPWAASIERRLARHRADALPFAVLCLEVADADRLLAADADRAATGALESAEAAILGQLRPADALIRERPGRYWLTTPDTDAADARALAHRVAAAIAGLPPHRGVPLQAAVGVATCPADGAQAGRLEGRAEEGLFAARAAGVRVAGPPD